MTMLLNQRRYRTRRLDLPAPTPGREAVRAPAPRTGKIADDAFMPSAQDDGFGNQRFATAGGPAAAEGAGAGPVGAAAAAAVPGGAASAAGAVAVPAEPVAPGTAIDAIRKENLSGRQLRMARRLAQKHGLPATSDFDAVRLLRQAGINPFQANSAVEVMGDGPAAAGGAGGLALAPRGDGVRLPQTIQPMQVPSTELRAEEAHIAEVRRIQADIVARRRRKSLLLLARLSAFILLPALLAGYYFYNVATPLYSTKSAFIIAQADPASAAGLAGAGSLLKGTPLAANTDSIAVQTYLQSPEAMSRLNSDLGFLTAFQAPEVDPIQRLEPGAPNSIAHKLYSSMVQVAYDPTEGVVKMEVIAPSPELAVASSKALIGYAEEQVAGMSKRLREDQMQGATQSYQDAEEKLAAANRRVVELQEKLKVISAEAEISLLTGQISQLESQLTQDQLALAEMESADEPNQARLEPLKRRIATLQSEIALRRVKLTEGDGAGVSVAQMQSELLVAQTDVQTRTLLVTQAATALEAARVEALRQNRYLNVAVNPALPDYPAYPRAFENTLVALLVLTGIYLLISMTIATLREQMSA